MVFNVDMKSKLFITATYPSCPTISRRNRCPPPSQAPLFNIMDSATTATIRHARSAAPYFTTLYSKLPADVTLDDVPITDHASYWAASVADPSLVRTGPHLDGVVMRTGGKWMTNLLVCNSRVQN